MSVLTATPPVATGARRIASLDIIRGGVMVLMAIDHVRVFSGLPAGGPTPGIFFTRWVTHFCAPAFVFLAGTAAFLHGRRLGDRAALSRFLLVRGAWLVLLELTFLRLAWTFNVDYAHYVLAGVIWVIGWCMILLAGLVHLPLALVGAFGLVVIAGHHVLEGYVPRLLESQNPARLVWSLLYLGPMAAGQTGPLVVLYSLVPWIGVIAAGYAFGAVMVTTPERRQGICRGIGVAAIGVLVTLRGTQMYGDPRPWDGLSVLGFLNTTKYPASLQFLCMTLGPVIALVPRLEQARGWLAQVLGVFGRVPLFYYLLHIPLIHVAACVVSLIRTGGVDPWLFANHPMMNPPPPDGYVWSLGLLYAVTAAVVVVLYVPCRWYAGLKARHPHSWLQLV
jgi:uncharacterized membrane protein